LNQNILVIAEKTPKYDGGSGGQKLLYTTYFQTPRVYYCIFNDDGKKKTSLEERIYYLDHKEKNPVQEKRWRYAGFVEYFSKKQFRFLQSEEHLSLIKDKVLEIIEENNIRVLVFEQTGILMWSWHRYFSDKIKCILRVHDSHYHYFLSDSKIREKWLDKIALIGSSIIQKKHEQQYFRKWDLIQFVSLREYQYYCTEYPDFTEKLIYTPPSIFIHRNEYLLNPNKTIDVLFVGTMSWKPNTDAVKWFLSEVLPLIKLEFPDIKVRIIGKNATQKIESQENNVEVIGFIESLDEVYKAAKLFINPSQSGGGVKIKLMEASAFGLPIVTTSQGISGFEDGIKEYLLAKDKPIDFARAVIQLLKNEDQRKDYSQRIFEYAQKKFDIQENQKVWMTETGKIL
jgi:glycosyltransferase involved in cell wall biosynthesis